MLADAKSKTLAENFAGQWLELRSLDVRTPDKQTFPQYDDGLKAAMRTETEMFFESIVREDRSVLDLLTADYTFVNERLAKHYGIPNVYGSHFRRVRLDETSPRRGLLGQGSNGAAGTGGQDLHPPGQRLELDSDRLEGAEQAVDVVGLFHRHGDDDAVPGGSGRNAPIPEG